MLSMNGYPYFVNIVGGWNTKLLNAGIKFNLTKFGYRKKVEAAKESKVDADGFQSVVKGKRATHTERNAVQLINVFNTLQKDKEVEDGGEEVVEDENTRGEGVTLVVNG